MLRAGENASMWVKEQGEQEAEDVSSSKEGVLRLRIHTCSPGIQKSG